MKRSTKSSTTIVFSHRRGVAPLEFILALPLLIVLVLALFHLAGGAIHRLYAIEVTRHKTWKSLPSTKPREQFALQGPVLDGKAADKTILPYRMGGWVAARYHAESESTALAGTWDRNEIPLGRSRPDYHVHGNVASDMLAEMASPMGAAGAFRVIGGRMRHLERIVGW